MERILEKAEKTEGGMNVIFHPLARRDIDEIHEYYGDISDSLPGKFDHDLQGLLLAASEMPERFHPVPGTSFRRINMRRFPHHILYMVSQAERFLRVMLIRHDKRHPAVGLGRR